MKIDIECSAALSEKHSISDSQPPGTSCLLDYDSGGEMFNLLGEGERTRPIKAVSCSRCRDLEAEKVDVACSGGHVGIEAGWVWGTTKLLNHHIFPTNYKIHKIQFEQRFN